MNKWNSRKFTALVITLLTNLLVWARVESELATLFASTAVNAVSLGYIVVQGWIDAKGVVDANSRS
jgi:hypothetical protein